MPENTDVIRDLTIVSPRRDILPVVTATPFPQTVIAGSQHEYTHSESLPALVPPLKRAVAPPAIAKRVPDVTEWATTRPTTAVLGPAS